jgi:hypothetical protein
MLRPLLLLATFLFSQPAIAGERIALVVGNSSYVHVPALDNPRNDAKLMADTLRGLGFTLIGGGAQLDLDMNGFEHAVQEFGAKLQGADVGLFYYAGHGVQVRGDNYLVPVNANPTREADVDFQMLNAGLVLRQMEAAGTRLNLMVLDACRNNPFGGRGLRASGGGLAQMQAPEGTLISYATQPGNVALDGSEGNSPYTRALAATMQSPGLDIFQTFNAVGLQVKRATGGSQQPWVASSPIDGTFYFVEGAPETAAASPPPAAPVPEAKLARLPDPAGTDAERPRGPREDCANGPGMTLCVSSALAPASGNNYGARNLIDGQDGTAWVEGSSGQGIGDFIVVEFPTAQSVRGFSLHNGYAKSSDIYFKNSRIKDIDIAFSSGDSLETTLTDTMGEQRVTFNRPVKAKWLRITIRSVYPGSKYTDAAINELRIELQ